MTKRQEIINDVSRHLSVTGRHPRNISSIVIQEAIEERGYVEEADSYKWVSLRNAIARQYFDRWIRKNASSNFLMRDMPVFS